jgi:hypothetical protein
MSGGVTTTWLDYGSASKTTIGNHIDAKRGRNRWTSGAFWTGLFDLF